MPTEPILTAAAASDVRPTSPTSDAPRIGRTGILFGLTGVFSFVLGSLILTRPEPLRAYANDAAVATARIEHVLGPVTDPTTGSTWTALIIQHSPDAARPPIAHITIDLDSPSGPVVHVAAAPRSSDATRHAPMVVAVTGNPADDTIDWRDDPTVRMLVARLCDKLKIDDRHVRWS